MYKVDNLNILTYNKFTKNSEYRTVKKIVRHKVSKRKFKISYNDKQVIITEDHGLMVYRNNELIRISPKEYKLGDKIVIVTKNKEEVLKKCLNFLQYEY
jgi:hypothetical protein